MGFVETNEVDRIIAAWQTELPSLDLGPIAVFSRLGRLARHLEIARRDAFGEHGLEEWEFDVLAALRRAGSPYELSPGSLAEQTLVTSGTMTNRIARLAQRGFVERLRDPSDRRGARVRITPVGSATVDAAMAGLVAYERGLLSGMDERALTELAGHLQTLLDPFESGTDEPR